MYRPFEKMFSYWLFFFSCIVAFLPLGSQASDEDGSVIHVQSSEFDHEIYPHHSIIHTLLHRFQGHQTANDLPQNWPVTPRKFAFPVYHHAAQGIASIGDLYHLSHGPAFVVRNADGIDLVQQRIKGALGKVNKQETTVYYPVNHPSIHNYFHGKRLAMPHLLLFKPFN